MISGLRPIQSESRPSKKTATPFTIVILFLLALGLQVGLTWLAVSAFQIPLSTSADAWEYVGITDNVIAGHGFATEREFPWRPDGARTPGMLLINVPLRLLFLNNDLWAALASRAVLALVGVLVGVMTAKILNTSYGLLAGAILILTPTISVYTINPFETELHYLLAITVLFLGAALAFTRRGIGLLMVMLGSGYAMLLRPAAQFPLIAVGLVCFIAAGVTRTEPIRRTVLCVAVSVTLSTCLAYGAWSARNHSVFGAFSFSTLGGNNLLHNNVGSMRPFMDPAAARDVSNILAGYPVRLPRYYGSDQFVIAAEQTRVAVGLLQKYPWAFLRSHLAGSWRAFALFEPGMLKDRLGRATLSLISLAQLVFTVGGFAGLVRVWRSCEPKYHLVLAVMLTAGIVSVLSAGVLASPRFRFPLEIPLAIGWVKLYGDVIKPRAFVHVAQSSEGA